MDFEAKPQPSRLLPELRQAAWLGEDIIGRAASAMGVAMDDGTLERRAMGAEQLVAAKITEFGAHLTAGDRAAAERARTEALAALEIHLDLTDQLISQTFA
nr:hypothetical protein [uncultured Brevundimonas sp.]